MNQRIDQKILSKRDERNTRLAEKMLSELEKIELPVFQLGGIWEISEADRWFEIEDRFLEYVSRLSDTGEINRFLERYYRIASDGEWGMPAARLIKDFFGYCHDELSGNSDKGEYNRQGRC